MCGFVGIFDVDRDEFQMRTLALKLSKKIRHRGPDWSGLYSNKKCFLAHERLSIIDPVSGGQPLLTKDGNVALAVNGEIYNHRDIRKKYEGKYDFLTNSDCEVILALYKDRGIDFLDSLSGIFAFALYDSEKDLYLIARDPIGVIPLYMGWDNYGQFYVASEMKALEGVCSTIEFFPPGCMYCSRDNKIVKWYHRNWNKYEEVANNDIKPEFKGSEEIKKLDGNGVQIGVDVNVLDVEGAAKKIRNALEKAVRRQLMSDVPYGVLLSGGLDSSIVAAVAKKYSAKRVETEGKSDAWWPQLHSFAIGLKGAPDLVAAQKTAEYIGTVHHEINYTIQEGLDALRDVIYHIETYDITTVRASTPMYLLSRVIKSMGIKMVLSGEGADEIFGGYLYFHKAPNAREFFDETIRKISKLHLYDCLRANKSLAAWGVEGRVPFLDKEFMDVAMSVNPQLKMVYHNPDRQGCSEALSGIANPGMEKWILRKAFEDMLPKSIVWRQKEQFSDGVGYNWIDTLKKITSEAVSDQQMEHVADRFPVNPPRNKEEYYYRCIFEEFFPSQTAAKTVPSVPSVACSTSEALAWDASFANMNDPSGRAVKSVHEK
ncbi:MAG: asparagine synthase B [Bacteroidales bacterium]|jgi:asparagine synthase (glutamine-hydrolysing)|nr:asparagine synthase B [Bacteroidales bacterium]